MSERADLQKVASHCAQLEAAIAGLAGNGHSFVIEDRMHELLENDSLEDFFGSLLFKLRSEAENRIGEINE